MCQCLNVDSWCTSDILPNDLQGVVLGQCPRFFSQVAFCLLLEGPIVTREPFCIMMFTCQLHSQIPDTGVRDMILDMIQVLPDKRCTPEEYLKMWSPSVFPDYFSPLLHDFFSYLVPLDTDNRVSHILFLGKFCDLSFC